MVVDTSALCAMLFNEPDRSDFARVMSKADALFVSTATLFEYHMVAIGRLRSDGESRAQAVLREFEIDYVAFNAAQEELARLGFQLYGRGRHPAGLNYGDCFSYALAKHLDEPLLFKGDDFSKTDVTPAL